MKSSVTIALLAAFLVEFVQASQTRDPNWRPPKPKKCPPGQVWKECVSRGCGEKTCPPKEFTPCLSTCEYGCYCADGYFRNSEGRCISECNSQSVPQYPRPEPPPATWFQPSQRPVPFPRPGPYSRRYLPRPSGPHTRPEIHLGTFPGPGQQHVPYPRPNPNTVWSQKPVPIAVD
uniref:TIL domain containing protein n=1 Tax=Rhipicephalus zambeziensis TaxID=60191 RepID=A0A224YR56_9ACAR